MTLFFEEKKVKMNYKFVIIVICASFMNLVKGETTPKETVIVSSLSELRRLLGSLRLEAEVDYAKATSKSSERMEQFYTEVPPKIAATLAEQKDSKVMNDSDESCRLQFNKAIFRVRQNALISAGLCGRNHQKYYTGHNLVLMLHINRTEELMQKLEDTVKTCNVAVVCRHNTQIRQLSRHINNHIARIQSDIPRVKLAYNDLNMHYSKKLKRIDRRAEVEAKKALHKLQLCNTYGSNLTL